MKAFQYLGNLFMRELKTYKNIHLVSSACTFRNPTIKFKSEKGCLGLRNMERTVHSEHDEDELEYSEFDSTSEPSESEKYFRTLLFSDSSDEIILKLNNCASVKDVINIINEYENVFSPEHMTQVILVLKDLQSVFYAYNGYTKKSLSDFTDSLKNTEGFQKLSQLISNNLDSFDPNLLSDIYVFLDELGIFAQDNLLQEISLKLAKSLEKEFKLDICVKLFKVSFRERSIRPYYISLEILPKLISLIGKLMFIVFEICM